MDKQLILSVAGSGKTTYLINQLSYNKRSLVITYTNNNLDNLRQKIREKFQSIPENIHVMNYYSFIFNFCYRPLLSYQYGYKSILFPPYEQDRKTQQNNIEKYFFSSSKHPYSNRIAKLMDVTHNIDNISKRLERYFDILMIDEVQDIAGHDFNLMIKLIKGTNIKMILVGDFYQHTYDTGRDGAVNKNLYGKGIVSYIEKFPKKNIKIDTTTLQKSYRCSFNICKFISEQLGIQIESHIKEKDDNTVVKLIEDLSEANKIISDNNIVKLFYQNHHKHSMYSDNWGASKGKDNYNDVCIIINGKNLEKYKNKQLQEVAPTTLNKLYVACSRANKNIYFIAEKTLNEIVKNKLPI